MAEWQSGEPADYVSVLFSPEVGFAFAPWFAFAVASAVAFWERPEKDVLTTRLGLLAGILLSLQYLTAFLFRAGQSALYLLPVVLVGAAAWAGRLRWAWLGSAIASLSLFAGIYVVVEGNASFWAIPFAAVFCLCVGAPLWAFLIYSHLLGCSISGAARRPLFSSASVGIAAWLAGYLGTLAFAARRMDEVYARLPASPPDACYVATAAARGHRFVVGSRVCCVGGKSVRINPQLKRLKSAELVLRRRLPRMHRSIRGIYDRVGPVLARWISSPLLAEVAYLSLKLPEGLAWAIVWWDVMSAIPPPPPRCGSGRRRRGPSPAP